MSTDESGDIMVKLRCLWGIYDDAIQTLPREQFEGIDLKEVCSIWTRAQNGETVQVTVKYL